jgi:signal transduction histidine kinase
MNTGLRPPIDRAGRLTRLGGWLRPSRLLPSPIARSLTVKLTLAFLTVGLLGALLVAVFVRQRTQSAFDQFVSDRGRGSFATTLAEYYVQNKGWDGVERVARPDPAAVSDVEPHPARYAVCAQDGQVVLGGGRYPVGSHVPSTERDRGVPIKVDGTIVGWLVGDLGPRPQDFGSPEADFLARVTRAISYGAIGATLVALALGMLLARTLTHPLRELTAATEVVAKGALGNQVIVRSRDELGTLAASFNQMSSDLAYASVLRRQMTADIAHDLRTPLTVILGYTEALRDGMFHGEQEIYDTMHTESRHLQHLIDDLRTLSLADAGELPLVRQEIAPQALLERAAAAYRARAEARQVTLATNVAADIPAIDVDPERLAQVLGNLVSNALRYTPVGGTITLSATSTSTGIQVRVEDTGSGIAPQDLPHIFERFYRADQAREQDGSSGLGLAIVKSIVEAHGGDITATSTPGQGTAFTIALPYTGQNR